MDDFQSQLQRMNDRLNGMNAGMESGFIALRKDIHYISRLYAPVIGLTVVSLVLSICAMVIALENRSLILNVQAETSKNTRDLENILPVVLAPDASSK